MSSGTRVRFVPWLHSRRRADRPSSEHRYEDRLRPAPEQIEDGVAEFGLGEELETGEAVLNCPLVRLSRSPVWRKPWPR